VLDRQVSDPGADAVDPLPLQPFEREQAPVVDDLGDEPRGVLDFPENQLGRIRRLSLCTPRASTVSGSGRQESPGRSKRSACHASDMSYTAPGA
jgi:hypothetical protein